MAYTSLGFTKDRGNYNTITSNGVGWHRYNTNVDSFDDIVQPNYFPPFIGFARDVIKINDLILTQDTTPLIRVYRIINLDPLVIEIAMSNIGEVKYIVYPAETNNTNEQYRARRISSNANFSFNFSIPLDFVSIESINLIGWAEDPASGTINLTSNYGAIGEDNQVHNESLVGISFVHPVDHIKFGIDLSGVLTDVEAADTGAVNIKQNNVGAQISYTMIELYYRTS